MDGNRLLCIRSIMIMHDTDNELDRCPRPRACETNDTCAFQLRFIRTVHKSNQLTAHSSLFFFLFLFSVHNLHKEGGKAIANGKYVYNKRKSDFSLFYLLFRGLHLFFFSYLAVRFFAYFLFSAKKIIRLFKSNEMNGNVTIYTFLFSGT